MITRLNRLPFASYKTPLLLGVTCLNFLFIGVDVLMAHSQSNFFRWALIPLIFSPLAVLAILAQLTFRANALVKRAFQTVMWLGVLVGVAGTILHLTGNVTTSSQCRLQAPREAGMRLAKYCRRCRDKYRR